MAELKTTKNDSSVLEFIASVGDDKKQSDSLALLGIFEEITGQKPAMWGSSIIGFGQYHYKSDRSKQEGDWPLTGFSPRKQNLTIYIMSGFADYSDQLEKLGKNKTSVSCLYIKRLSDVNVDVLKEIIKDSYEKMKLKHNA